MGVFDEFEQQRSSVFNTLPNTNNSIVFPSVFEGHSRNEGFYERGIDFDKLFKQIKAAAGGGSGFFHFDYKDFISTNKKTEIVFPTKMSLRPKVLEYLVDVPLEIEDDLGEVRQVQLTGKLNRSIAIVDVTTFYIRAIVKVNNGVPIYELYVMYKDAKNSRFRTDRHRVAFSIQAHTFNDFVAVYNEFNAEDNSFLEALVIKQFNKSFAAVGSDPDKLDWLYFYAPDVVLQNRPIEKRWKDLGVLLRHSVDEVGTNEELAVLSLLNSLVIDKRILTSEEDLQTNTVIQAIDHFLNELIRRKVTKGQTYFEILYEKLNNYGLGNDNFTALLRLIYRYWLFSSYSSFDKPNNGLLPEVIAYQNNKVLGFFSDNYNFDFVKEQSQLKIKVTRLVPSEDVNDLRDKVASLTPRALKILGIDNVASFLPETLKPSGIARLDKLLFRTEVVGVYDIFQPIQIISTTTDSAGNEIALQQPHVVQGGITLPAMTIPAFYLKAFDDEKTWENIDKGVWLTLDIVTAITGVGNLLKLRHLRHLTKTAQVAKFLIGFVEVTAGVMSAMITLSDNCNEGTLTNDKELERRAKIAEALAEGKKPQKTFCESLKEYLFWAEIATLGADVFISRILKVKAKQTLDSADELLDPAIRRHLEEVAELERISEFDGGKIIPQRLLRKRIRNLVQEYNGMKLEVHFVDEVTNIKKHIDWKKRNVFGSFHQGPPPRIFLRREVTQLTWQHELWHLEDLRLLGRNKYKATRNWKHEESVWNKIWETRVNWTEEELVDSYNYYIQYSLSTGGEPKINTFMETLVKKYIHRKRFKT